MISRLTIAQVTLTWAMCFFKLTEAFPIQRNTRAFGLIPVQSLPCVAQKEKSLKKRRAKHVARRIFTPDAKPSLEQNLDSGSHTLLTLQGEAGIVIGGAVFDDGEPKSRSADRL